MFAGVWRPCQPALCNGINGLGWTRTRWPNYRSKAWVTLRELGSFSLSRVSPSERRCYIRNVFSHWDPIQPQTEYWSALGQHIRTFSQSHTGNYIRCSSIVVVWYMLIDWLIDLYFTWLIFILPWHTDHTYAIMRISYNTKWQTLFKMTHSVSKYTWHNVLYPSYIHWRRTLW